MSPVELKLIAGLGFQFGDRFGGLVLSFQAFENACPRRLDRVGREIVTAPQDAAQPPP